MDGGRTQGKKSMARPLIRKSDFLIIGSILAFATVFSFFLPSHQTASTVIVEVGGREAYRYAIQRDGEYHILAYDPRDGTKVISHTLHIHSGQVYVKDAQCRDRLCEKMGKIVHPGQIIVCVPFKVLIRIESYRDNPLGYRDNPLDYQVGDNDASPDVVTR